MLPEDGARAADLARLEIESVAHGVPSRAGGAPRPIGVLRCDRSAASDEHLARVRAHAVVRGDDATALARVDRGAPLVFETATGGDVAREVTGAAARFVLRYNERFTPRVSPKDAPAAPYDAVYLLAYAAHVAGDGPLEGDALARALSRIAPGGKRVDIGSATLFDALRELDEGKDLDPALASTSAHAFTLDARAADARR
jgi:hypothetical protein